MLSSIFRNAAKPSACRRIMKSSNKAVASSQQRFQFFSTTEEKNDIEDAFPSAPMSDDHGMDPNVQKVFDSITKLTMLEIAELATALQKKFNLPDQAMMMAGGGGGGGGGGAAASAEPVEEKTAFDVKLASFDAKGKIKIIKEVRAITGLGLKEAKALVESVPAVLKKDLKKEEADALAEKLKELGGVVELE